MMRLKIHYPLINLNSNLKAEVMKKDAAKTKLGMAIQFLLEGLCRMHAYKNLSRLSVEEYIGV